MNGLSTLRVVAFESRRAVEIAELIRRHGGTPISAPCMREVALENPSELANYMLDLEAGRIDVVILLTGVGLRSLMKQLEPEWPQARFTAALRRAKLVARGPKPVAVLRQIGLQADVTVPEPNTWRELLASLDAHIDVAGRAVAIQEYGISNSTLIDGLQQRGARVRRVVIYRWALPEDLAPLRTAIEVLQARQADIAVFTSANQVYTLFDFAEREHAGAAERIRRGFGDMLIASIGPVCSNGLREHGIEPDFEPQHAKMGQLISELASCATSRLAGKRA